MKHTDKPRVEIHMDSLVSVANALWQGDISECKVGEVREAAGVLSLIVRLEELAPGFVPEMLGTFLPYFTKKAEREVIGRMIQDRANSEGFGSEWRAAVEAGISPKKKDYLYRVAELFMAFSGMNEDDSAHEISHLFGREIEDVKRQIRRSKSRIREE